MHAEKRESRRERMGGGGGGGGGESTISGIRSCQMCVLPSEGYMHTTRQR